MKGGYCTSINTRSQGGPLRSKKALGHEGVAKSCVRLRESFCSSSSIFRSTMALAKSVSEFLNQSAGVILAKELHHQKQSDLVSRKIVDILRCADLL